MRLCSTSEIMACDRQAIDQLGIPGAILMENAGRNCCRLFSQKFEKLFPGPVLVLAGKGNNGGDGYVMARILADCGWQVITLMLGREEAISGDAGIMLKVLRGLKLLVGFVADLCQLLDGFAAATLGAWLHGRSAELVADQQGTAGMAASDLLPRLPVARQELAKGVCSC